MKKEDPQKDIKKRKKVKPGYWNEYENVLEEAKKYLSLTEFRNSGNIAYEFAKKNDWLKNFPWLENKSDYSIFKNVEDKAKKCKTVNQFKNSYIQAYNSAVKNNWLRKFTWLKDTKRKSPGYWNIEENVTNLAKQCKNAAELESKSVSAYKSALKNGWLRKFTWFSRATPTGWWSVYERVEDEARKYKNSKEFEKGSPGAFSSARKHKWLKKFTWFKPKCVPKGWWESLDHCRNFIIENNLKSRGDVYKANQTCCESIRKHNWWDLIPEISNHADIDGDRIDCVYVYKFEEQHAIYVGRTLQPDVRHIQHRNNKNDAVYKFFSENNLPCPEMEIIESNLTLRQGSEREIYWEKHYREEGWIILNRAKPGALGGISGKYYSKNECWMYVWDNVPRRDLPHRVKEYFKKLGLLDFFFPPAKTTIPIDVYTEKEVYIGSYSSIIEACYELESFSSKDRENISAACREEKILKGFRFLMSNSKNIKLIK